jgi:hypothetical protein
VARELAPAIFEKVSERRGSATEGTDPEGPVAEMRAALAEVPLESRPKAAVRENREAVLG